MNPENSEVANRDLRELMLTLGMSIHARPKSPHEVFQDEVIPRVRDLKAAERILEAVIEWSCQLQRNKAHENEFMVMAAIDVDRLIEEMRSGRRLSKVRP